MDLSVLGRLDLMLVVLVLLGAFVWRSKPDRPSLLIAVAGSAVAACLPIAGYWLSGRSHPNAVAGLIQWNDAAGYLDCAWLAVSGTDLVVPGCSMRPYYSAIVGTLLTASSGSVQGFLLLQAALVGASLGVLAHRLAGTLGTAPAIVGLAALLSFSGQFSVTTLTENGGIALGCLAFAMLWTSGERIAPWLLAISFYLLGLALNSRPGAMFVLPLLLMAVWRLRPTWKMRLPLLCASIAGLLLSMVVNFVLVNRYGGGVASSNTNFAYVLYGLSARGSSYLQILADHPEVGSLTGKAFLDAVYGHAWRNIVEHPQWLAVGYGKGIAHWLYHLFDFLPVPLRLGFVALWLVGLREAWRRRDCGWRRDLVRFGLSGVAVSSPFLTFYGGTRIFAATFALDAILVTYGALRVLRSTVVDASNEGQPSGLRVVGLGAALLATLPMGLIDWSRHHPLSIPVSPAHTCATGERAVAISAASGMSILRISTTGTQEVLRGGISTSWESFSRNMDLDVAFREELLTLPPGSNLVQAMQLLRDRRYGELNVFVTSEDLVARTGIIRLCLRPGAGKLWVGHVHADPGGELGSGPR